MLLNHMSQHQHQGRLKVLDYLGLKRSMKNQATICEMSQKRSQVVSRIVMKLF